MQWEALHRAASLIPLQFIHNQYSTLPKWYFVFSLITTKSVLIVQGQHLPELHIARLSRGEKSNNWAPSNMTSAKTIAIWNFFSCSHSKQNLQSSCLSEDKLLLYTAEQIMLPKRECFAGLALCSFRAAPAEPAQIQAEQ